MNRILSIQGGMAGGKTTLARKLEGQMDGVYFTYENPYPIVEKRKSKNLDIYTKDGFVENQRLFIEAEVKRFNSLPNGKVIFDRGPEDIEFYTLHFPGANGFDWEMEQLLKEELQELRRCRSDIILYLDASEETLCKRKQNDFNRRRSAFNKNMELYKFEKEWYKQLNTRFLNVDNKTAVQVEKWTLEFLKEIDFL